MNPAFISTALSRSALALCLTLLASVGCGDDDGPAPRDAGSHLDAALAVEAGPSGSSGDASVATNGEAGPSVVPSVDGGLDAGRVVTPVKKTPLVIVSEREGLDTAQQYLHVLADWPADHKLDYQTAVELGESVLTHAGDGAVFVYTPEGATMQRYAVDGALAVKADLNLSFAALGVTGMDADTIWVSPERAFLVDEASGQIILWNPKTMAIVTSVDIDPALLTKNGLKLQLQQDGVVSGGRAFLSANWRSWDTGDFVSGAALAYFDTAQDKPELKIVHEDRCASSIAAPYVDEAGNVYVLGDAALGYDALANLKKSPLPQCVRRVLAGQTEFDPNFFVDLQVASGSPGFRSAHPMSGGKLLLNAWSPSLTLAEVADPKSGDWYWELGAYFEYTIVDLTNKTSAKVVALPLAAAQFSLTLRVDGLNYVQSYRADNGASLRRVDGDGTVTDILDLGAGSDVQYVGRL